MSSRRPLSDEVAGASFSFFTADDIRKLSIKQITNSTSFDELQNPIDGGLYDPALGPLDRKAGQCAFPPSPCPRPSSLPSAPPSS